MKMLWVYDGPIYRFDQIAEQRWTGYTYAQSKEKASSNLAFQAKKRLGLEASTKVTVDITRVKLGGNAHE